MRHSYLPFLLSSRLRSPPSSCNTQAIRPLRTTSSRFYSSLPKTSSHDTATTKDSSVEPSSSLAFDDKHSPRPNWNPSLRHSVVPYPITSKKYVARGSGILKPPYADSGILPANPHGDAILIHDDPDDLDAMRTAAKLARRILDHACALAKPGVTTDEIDTAVHEALLEAGAYPSPLNYVGFPKSLCSSINEVICHGIPDTRPLVRGDIVSFDVSCFIGGVHGDNCATILVGDEQEIDEIGVDWRGVPYKSTFDSVDEEVMFRAGRRLIHATRESLYEAIDRIGPGACLTEVGAAIEDVADAYGYSTVAKYRGHGIGEVFHCAPFVKHYRNQDKLELVPGMIFTIEPMLVERSGDCYEWEDQWTVQTVDGGMSAQFEHTILITDNGVEILTVAEDE
ncbi:methionine aminopeptidase [Nitzschia inconspicua]|uniref:Methionine aminopeptidase n=1 Tax=Nitzschia inconspicua TaxID=303405 RepID=A0A9K3Q4E3_9STRA|nr:methionine aminopeptidase [Nitzschia inconspicua]